MPKVILLDQRMPGIDGLSTLKQIRQIDGSEDIEIVIVTAFKSCQLVIDALQNGASDFIIKPVTHDSIEKLIDRVFRQRDIRKRKTIGAGSDVKRTEEGLRLQTVTQVGKALSCEMGNPLQAILGSAELMSKGKGVVRNMEKIERGVAKILEILDKFSNATRVKTAKVFMDDEMIDIRAMESIDIKRTV
jgi:DNA-binding response OmpR family regulator